MKAIFKSVVVIAALAMMASCGGSMNPDTISEKQILELVNQQLEDRAENVEYLRTLIPIGTFECDSDDYRELLRKLDEAGIINYKVTRYAWWEKGIKDVRVAYEVLKEGYWYSYYDTEYKWEKREYTEFMDHYVVTTKLTSKGKKLMVESIPEPKANDPEAESKEIDHSKCSWNTKDLSENWPYIENPFEEKKPAEKPKKEETPVEEAVVAEETVVAAEPEAKEEDKVQRKDEEQYKAFLKVETDVKEVILKSNDYEAIIARNIYITERDGVKYAHAEVIYSTTNTNDAARILEGAEDDQRDVEEVELIYYLDKGWVLNN